jgi:hypothetical protein
VVVRYRAAPTGSDNNDGRSETDRSNRQYGTKAVTLVDIPWEERSPSRFTRLLLARKDARENELAVLFMLL